MSLPDSIAWLQTSQDSHSPSLAKVYAAQILGELERLNQTVETCARELEFRERLLAELTAKYHRREYEFELLVQQAMEARDEWDAERVRLTRMLLEAEERLGVALG